MLRIKKEFPPNGDGPDIGVHFDGGCVVLTFESYDHMSRKFSLQEATELGLALVQTAARGNDL